MFNMKALAVASALAVGTAFVMPATSQAAIPVAPVKIQTVQDGNVVEVKHKKKWRRDGRRWRGGDNRRWRGGDNRRWREARRWRGDNWRGHRRHRYYEPYYYDPYYYGGYNGPGYWGPGISLQFRID